MKNKELLSSIGEKLDDKITLVDEIDREVSNYFSDKDEDDLDNLDSEAQDTLKNIFDLIEEDY